MNLWISVTQSMIDKGQRHFALSCPIARALKEKGIIEPIVGVETVCGQLEPGIYDRFAIPLNKRMVDWIDAFDRGYAVKPTRFLLKIP